MRKTKILSVFLVAALLFPSYSVFAEEGETMTPSEEAGETVTQPKPEANNEAPETPAETPEAPTQEPVKEPDTPPSNIGPNPTVYNTYYQKAPTASGDTQEAKETPEEPAGEAEEPVAEIADPKAEQLNGPKLSTESEVADGKQLAEAKRNDAQQSWWVLIISATAIFILAQFINPNKRVKA